VPKFRKTIDVNASIDEAWAIVGDLTVMGSLAGASDVKVEGMKRICTFANGAVQHEEITNYSKENHSYNYAIEGSQLPVKHNRGKFTIESKDKNSTIVWDAEFETLDPPQEAQISQMWDGAMKQVLEQIKRLIEEKK
jgi:carbon monoxide dehydrogenase subunit G